MARKIFILQKRTEWMCNELSQLNIEYYRHEMSNIITIKSRFISKEIVHKFALVPDYHAAPKWYKIVIMNHVTIEKLMMLIDNIKKEMKELHLK